MSNQIAKQEGTREITAVGEQFLKDLRSCWKPKPYARKRSGVDADGNLVFRDVMVTPEISNESLNVFGSPEDLKQAMYYFASLMTKEDLPRIKGIIEKNQFEVRVATKCFLVQQLYIEELSLQPRSWDECKQVGSPSLAKLKKYCGLNHCLDIVNLMVIDFVTNFGSKNHINEAMARLLAAEIIALHYTLTIADLKKIFNDALENPENRASINKQYVKQLIANAKQEKEMTFANRVVQDLEAGKYQDQLDRQQVQSHYAKVASQVKEQRSSGEEDGRIAGSLAEYKILVRQAMSESKSGE